MAGSSRPRVNPRETSADAYRFAVPVAPASTATFTVEERKNGENTIQIASVTDDQLLILIRNSRDEAALRQALQPLIERKAQIARLSAQVTDKDNALADQDSAPERARENMEALKDAPRGKKLIERYAKQMADAEDAIAVSATAWCSCSPPSSTTEQSALQTAIERLALDVVLATN